MPVRASEVVATQRKRRDGGVLRGRRGPNLLSDDDGASSHGSGPLCDDNNDCVVGGFKLAQGGMAGRYAHRHGMTKWA